MPLENSDIRTLIKMVREDPLIGRGSCSSIDECWEDWEIENLFEIWTDNNIQRSMKMIYQAEIIFVENWLGTEPENLKLVQELKERLEKLEDKKNEFNS